MKKQKDKRWEIDIEIKFTQICDAPSKAEAIELTKTTFGDEYGITLTDEEIVKVRKQK